MAEERVNGAHGSKCFLDTNVLFYALPGNTVKAEIARALMNEGGQVSVQVLNELVSTARKKLRASWAQIQVMLQAVQAACGEPLPLTEEVHSLAVQIAERYGFHIYDANVVACALLAGCTTLYSEDMQSGQRIEGLLIENPFREATAS